MFDLNEFHSFEAWNSGPLELMLSEFDEVELCIELKSNKKKSCISFFINTLWIPKLCEKISAFLATYCSLCNILVQVHFAGFLDDFSRWISLWVLLCLMCNVTNLLLCRDVCLFSSFLLRCLLLLQGDSRSSRIYSFSLNKFILFWVDKRRQIPKETEQL